MNGILKSDPAHKPEVCCHRHAVPYQNQRNTALTFFDDKDRHVKHYHTMMIIAITDLRIVIPPDAGIVTLRVGAALVHNIALTGGRVLLAPLVVEEEAGGRRSRLLHRYRSSPQGRYHLSASGLMENHQVATFIVNQHFAGVAQHFSIVSIYRRSRVISGAALYSAEV